MISAGFTNDSGRIHYAHFCEGRRHAAGHHRAMSRLLTVRDAADALGVTYSTLKQWIYKGSVRTVRTEGGHHRIAEDEVERLLDQHGPPAKRRKTPRSPATGVLVALSGRNQLRGIVDEVRSDGLLAQVRLRIGGQFLTAIITRDALRELKLRRGDEAVAIMKATEVMLGRSDSAKFKVQSSK
jgi:molybdopterin-binding protein